jgi:hypothetical protein
MEIYETMYDDDGDVIFQTAKDDNQNVGLIIITNEGKEICLDMDVQTMEKWITMQNRLLESML